MNFKAEMKNGVPIIKAKVERKKNKNGGWDVTVCVPTLKLINEFRNKYKKDDSSIQQNS